MTGDEPDEEEVKRRKRIPGLKLEPDGTITLEQWRRLQEQNEGEDDRA